MISIESSDEKRLGRILGNLRGYNFPQGIINKEVFYPFKDNVKIPFIQIPFNRLIEEPDLESITGIFSDLLSLAEEHGYDVSKYKSETEGNYLGLEYSLIRPVGTNGDFKKYIIRPKTLKRENHELPISFAIVEGDKSDQERLLDFYYYIKEGSKYLKSPSTYDFNRRMEQLGSSI